jgi:putative ABC transport system permease protein
MQKCFAKLGGGQNVAPGAGAGGFGGGRGQGGGNRGAFAKCLPARLQKLRTQFTSPSQTLRQVLNPPQTNITSTAYTIGGVDQSRPTMGSVTPAQVSSGRFLSAAGGHEALVSTAYAVKHTLKVGSALDLNGTKYAVVGLVDPAVGGQSADVYLPLNQLQTLAKQTGLANVVLVRAKSSADVARVKSEILAADPQAQVATSKDVANTVTGSLVDAKNLASSIGLVLAIVAAVAAFLLAALLALSSVGKRTRELGTLKALGWTQRQVVRQIAGESLVTGVLGGIFGIGLGVVVALAVDAFGPSLTASASTGGGAAALGLGTDLARTATRSVALSAPVGGSVLAIGFALALLGGLVAGTAAAMRAARLRPADALRTVE